MLRLNWIITFALTVLILLESADVNSESSEQAVSTTPSSEDDDDWDEDDSTEIDDDSRIYKNPRNSPSTLCPRDEEQATLLGQKCLRKCSSDEDCKSKKKKCLCDGACGMSCIKPDRECPEPEQIALGTATATGRLFGARASYTCEHGYHVVGLQSRTCQADGQWAGSPPACKQNIYCLSPPTIDHARHNALTEQTTFDLDSTLQYYCHTGYVTNGFPRAKCLAIDGQASWYGPDISCEPRSCGPPTDISHGWHAGECYTYGCRISYHCADGFELVGRNERFCQADGTWSPKELPTCVLVTAVQCPPPENPRHGKAIYTSCSYNSVVSYECKYGYTLVGETTRRCGADKKWSGSQPQCKAPCVVPQVSQGRVILMSRNDTAPSSMVVQDGEALTVDCEPFYEFFLNTSPVVCNNGTWTHIPKCQPARCKHLPKSPKNGMIIAPKMEHGMKARFRCKDGFEIKGNTLIECSFGNWTGEFPSCQEVYCPFPGLVENGKILLVGNMGLYDYRPYVKKVQNNKQIMYDCDKGYVLSAGPPGATCIGGNWSPRELPKCTLGQHPRLRWSRRKRYAILKRYKQELTKYLNDKVMMFHNFVSKYITSNLKSSDKPKHIQKRALKTGSASSSSKTLGLGLKTSKSQPNARRNKNKQTNNDIKLDRRKFCNPLSEEPYATTEVIKYGYDPSVPFSSGSIVKMTCDKGYGLNLANNTVKCVRGKWRPMRPKCLNAPCSLPPISNGEYLSGYRTGLTIANGSSVSYQCGNDSKKALAQTVYCFRGELKPHLPGCGGVSDINGTKDSSFYVGGSDIVRGGDLDTEYGGIKKSCGPPARVQGSLLYRNGEPITENDDTFPDDTEVTFSCIESIVGEKTTWKIVCEDGSWIGRALTCEELLSVQSSNTNGTCIFRNQEPNVVTFYNDQEITEEIAEFPESTILTGRCTDIGKFSMTGSNIRRCISGEWDGQKPVCFGLNQKNDYSMEKPPTILFRHELGPIAQSNEGKLIVYPGVILHMECLWIRRFGFPKWTVSHDYRQYPQSWTTDPGRDSQLEYRLSIYYASRDDSGTFTCVTPARYTHSVEVVVKAIHCPAIPQRRGLTSNTQSTKMNTEVTFNCENGNALIGASEVVCLPSGNWSSPFPICESIECGEVGGLLPQNLKVSIVSRDVGGRAVFTCTAGFGLRGPAETTCLPSGEWALPYPNCSEVQCENPAAPENGYIQGNGPFKAGDVVQYNCNPDFMMDGQPIIACQDNGRWSGPTPKCIQACSYPGTTISGRMSSVKFYYRIGENITFSCEENLVLNGASMLKCLKNGKWSNTIPTCISADTERR